VTGAIVTASVSATAATFLYGIEPGDPRIVTLTMGVVVVAALAAAVVPVRRALAIDPVRAVKEE
jgi:ABC-type antimicrobial peptide transport system permease subunit